MSRCPFHNLFSREQSSATADPQIDIASAGLPAAEVARTATTEIPDKTKEERRAGESLSADAAPSECPHHKATFKNETFRPVGKALLPEETQGAAPEKLSFREDLAERLKRLPGQVFGKNPFSGTLEIERLPLIGFLISSATKFKNPIRIMDEAFKNGSELAYYDLPGFAPLLFVRDPQIILEVLKDTANKGSFERDRLETQGIGRVVGQENLLYLNDEAWKAHKTAMKGPLGGRAINTPELFSEMEGIIGEQLKWLEDKVREGGGSITMQLEGSIKVAMLELLAKTMFGVTTPRQELRDKYLPAIERVIDYIQMDTVFNRVGISLFNLPTITPGQRQLKEDYKVFEELVDKSIACRETGGGLWRFLKEQGTDEALRSNVKVLLAGALEATSSYITWTLFNLARNPEAQEKVAREAMSHEKLTPEARDRNDYLPKVLSESLRMQAPLYILPRIAEEPVSVTTPRGTLNIPKGTHIILGSYHAGRNERHWGEAATGYPASEFVPERWEPENLKSRGRAPADNKHFGFGHGPRICSGLLFGEAEAFLCVSMFAKKFKITAVQHDVETISGIASRPKDRLDVKIEMR